MKPLLALDLGSKTGYALRYASGEIDCGTWILAPEKTMRGHRKAELERCWDPRVCQLAALVNHTITTHNVRCVGFEDVQFSSSTAQTQLWASFRTVLWLAYCGNPAIRLVPVPVGTLKKFGSGSGNADKDQMAKALVRKYPNLDISSLDDNAVDARHLLDYLIQHHV